jgi:hypothetical protein
MSREEWKKKLLAEAVARNGRPLLAARDVQEKGTGDCNTCQFWRRVGNKKFTGHRIPGGYGKCTRPGDACHPAKVRTGIGAYDEGSKRCQA